MPKSHARCPQCDLSFEEAMRRSDLPESERPPEALYVPQTADNALRDDQKFWIGLWFCAACFALALGHWLSGALFFGVAAGCTPALRQKIALSNRLYRSGLVLLALAAMLSF